MLKTYFSSNCFTSKVRQKNWGLGQRTRYNPVTIFWDSNVSKRSAGLRKRPSVSVLSRGSHPAWSHWFLLRGQLRMKLTGYHHESSTKGLHRPHLPKSKTRSSRFRPTAALPGCSERDVHRTPSGGLQQPDRSLIWLGTHRASMLLLTEKPSSVITVFLPAHCLYTFQSLVGVRLLCKHQ